MIKADQAAEMMLNFRPLTLFAPTNRAFQAFGNNKTSVFYHMCECLNQLAGLTLDLYPFYDGCTIVNRYKKDIPPDAPLDSN